MAATVTTGRFRTAPEVQRWIATTFAVAMRPRSVYDLLARPRCDPKVPRPLHEQADPTTQAAEKKGLTAALSAAGLGPTATVGYFAELRWGLVGATRRRWGRWGTKLVPYVPRRYQ